MKNILIIILLIFFQNNITAQIVFEFNKLTITSNGRMEVLDMKGTLNINSDTTEIIVNIASLNIHEKIVELYSRFEDSDYNILVYKLESEDIAIFHIQNKEIFSIVLQTDIENQLEFEK
jgi:hypothetical protein